MTLKILNNKQKRMLTLKLKEEYGVGEGILENIEVLQSDDDIWVTTNACLQQKLGNLRVDSIGLQLLRDGKPTIHGIQLLLKTAEMTELTQQEAGDFIDGRTLKRSGKIMSYRKHPLDLTDETRDGIRRRK